VIIDNHDSFRLRRIAFRVLVSRSGVFHLAAAALSKWDLKSGPGSVEISGACHLSLAIKDTPLARFSDAGNLDQCR
jgi:hypothetical protein